MKTFFENTPFIAQYIANITITTDGDPPASFEVFLRCSFDFEVFVQGVVVYFWVGFRKCRGV